MADELDVFYLHPDESCQRARDIIDLPHNSRFRDRRSFQYPNSPGTSPHRPCLRVFIEKDQLASGQSWYFRLSSTAEPGAAYLPMTSGHLDVWFIYLSPSDRIRGPDLFINNQSKSVRVLIRDPVDRQDRISMYTTDLKSEMTRHLEDLQYLQLGDFKFHVEMIVHHDFSRAPSQNPLLSVVAKASVGTRLADDWRDTDRIIGTGGFGCVLLQRNIRSGDLRAVKFTDVPITDERHQAYAQRELDLSASFDHDNIAKCLDKAVETVYESVTPKKRYKLMMELYPMSLARLLELGRGNDYLKMAALATCRGLQYLHDDRNIIHRDLKPGNVLVRFQEYHRSTFLLDDKDPKWLESLSHCKIDTFCISDMGLARGAQSFYLTNCGADAYRAPEISKDGDNEYNKSADIYSLGIMLFEMMDRNAFNFFSSLGIPEFQNQVRAYIERRPGDELCKVIAAMTAENPRQRPCISQVLDFFTRHITGAVPRNIGHNEQLVMQSARRQHQQMRDDSDVTMRDASSIISEHGGLASAASARLTRSLRFYPNPQMAARRSDQEQRQAVQALVPINSTLVSNRPGPPTAPSTIEVAATPVDNPQPVITTLQEQPRQARTPPSYRTDTPQQNLPNDTNPARRHVVAASNANRGLPSQLNTAANLTPSANTVRTVLRSTGVDSGDPSSSTEVVQSAEPVRTTSSGTHVLDLEAGNEHGVGVMCRPRPHSDNTMTSQRRGGLRSRTVGHQSVLAEYAARPRIDAHAARRVTFALPDELDAHDAPDAARSGSAIESSDALRESGATLPSISAAAAAVPSNPPAPVNAVGPSSTADSVRTSSVTVLPDNVFLPTAVVPSSSTAFVTSNTFLSTSAVHSSDTSHERRRPDRTRHRIPGGDRVSEGRITRSRSRHRSYRNHVDANETIDAIKMLFRIAVSERSFWRRVKGVAVAVPVAVLGVVGLFTSSSREARTGSSIGSNSREVRALERAVRDSTLHVPGALPPSVLGASTTSAIAENV